MYCAKCGFQAEAEDQFCTKCGAAIREPSSGHGAVPAPDPPDRTQTAQSLSPPPPPPELPFTQAGGIDSGKAAGKGSPGVFGTYLKRPKRASQADRYPRIDAPLPVEQWIQQSQQFTFGTPFGWAPWSQEDMIAAMAFDPSKGQALAGARAIKTNQPTTNVVVNLPAPDLTRDDEFMLAMPSFARKRADALFPGRVVQGPTYLSVGGQPAMILGMEMVQTREDFGDRYDFGNDPILTASTEVWTVWHGHVYVVAMFGRADERNPYLPGLYTMLGTWRWE